MPAVRTKTSHVPVDVTTISYNPYPTLDAYSNDELWRPLAPSYPTPFAIHPLAGSTLPPFVPDLSFPDLVQPMQLFQTPMDPYTVHQSDIEYDRWLTQLLDAFDTSERPSGYDRPQVLPLPAIDASSTLQPPPIPDQRPPPNMFHPVSSSSSGVHTPSKRRSNVSNIKKPSNAFILYRSDLLTRLPREKTKGRNASVVAGEHWRELSPAQQQPWYDLAQKEKIKYEMKMAAFQEKSTQSDPVFG